MWLALDARWLKTQQRSLSWVYDAALRSELAGRLGLDWEPVPDGSGQDARPPGRSLGESTARPIARSLKVPREISRPSAA